MAARATPPSAPSLCPASTRMLFSFNSATISATLASHSRQKSAPSAPHARGLVHLGILAEIRHDLFREELHHLERRLVAAAVHAGTDDPGFQLIGEHAELVPHGGRTA